VPEPAPRSTCADQHPRSTAGCGCTGDSRQRTRGDLAAGACHLPRRSRLRQARQEPHNRGLPASGPDLRHQSRAAAGSTTVTIKVCAGLKGIIAIGTAPGPSVGVLSRRATRLTTLDERSCRSASTTLKLRGRDERLSRRSRWWGPCEHGVGGRQVIAIDGKTVRGARTQAPVVPHLVSGCSTTPPGPSWGSWRPRRRATRSPPYEHFLAGLDLAPRPSRSPAPSPPPTTTPHHHAAPPRVLAVRCQGHWGIEVRHEALRFRVGVRDP